VGGTAIGELCPQWAGRLGLGPGVVVASGTVDAHTGAFGAGVRPGILVQILGTSACSVMVSPRPGGTSRPIRGICGQVDGSVIGGFEGYEAGQSAFGDVLAWFRDLLLWPQENLAGTEEKVLGRDCLFSALEAAAAKNRPGASGLIALDWFNGRRSPDEDPARRGLIAGLSLGAKAPELYRALIESLAFGSRAIVERFREEGVAVGSVVATGGIARKSELVMQVMADVLGMRIGVPSSEETVALGAAMFAATAAGLYPDALSAQAAMASPIGKILLPDSSRGVIYDGLYRRYLELGSRLC
jgi:L-ribulokinase